jgi:catechol 2,3-dioxygenase-like lactoylglutathione lyase family enzyme
MPSRKKKVEPPAEPPAARIDGTTLKFMYTRLLVENTDVCYKFYRDVLGFKPRFDGEGSVYAEFDAGAHTLALFSRKLMHEATAPGTPMPTGRVCDSVLLAIEVGNVDQAYEELKRRGVQFVTPPHDQKDWLLRVAHFRDPDGNLLEINAGLAPAAGASGQAT